MIINFLYRVLLVDQIEFSQVTVYVLQKKKSSNQTTQCLHFTFNVAVLQAFLPMPLFASHLYFPASAFVTFFIHSLFLSAEKVPLSIGDPSLVHDNHGSGFPIASQEKEISCLATFVVFSRWIVICGSSIYMENYISKHPLTNK